MKGKALLFILLSATLACAQSQRKLEVMPRPVVAGPETLPPAAEGEAYSFTFTASKCPAPCTFRAEELPAWLALSAAGVLSGTAPACTPAAGQETCPYEFRVFASNKFGLESAALTIGIEIPGAPREYEVALTWDASPTPGVSYPVQRRHTGAYAAVATAACCQYVDRAVERGATYTYRVLARNSQGVESAPSNEAVAVIPRVAVA